MSMLKKSLEKLLLASAAVGLLAGAWMIGQISVTHLLRHDAIMTGEGWAHYLADNVKDLEAIIAGQKPSAESARFFERAQKVGQVFRYVVYDADGRTRLASDDMDDDDDDAKDANARNLSAVRAMTTGAPVVHAEEADEDERKVRAPFFAETYLPVVIGGRKVGVVETYVDQTEKRDAYRHTMLLASSALVLLLGVAFGIPTFAWQRRSREKQLADARIHFLAHHDTLTGLINRDQLANAVTEVLAKRAGQPDAATLHYVDVDHFKDINDTLGHETGDALICAVAERLRGLAGPRNVVARIGGDEFVVLETERVDEARDGGFAATLVEELARPFLINRHEAAVTVSIGVATAPQHGDDVVRLMKSADLALYRAKTNGRNGMAVFTPEMDRELVERLRLERAVRKALENDSFELHYQPVVGMPARRLIGFEALLRMRDEMGNAVSPVLFVPLAEKMGLIEGIGAWVLRHACRTAATWPDHLKVAVNLSPAQISTGRLVDTVRAVLEETGLAPRRLELEITEGVLLDNSADVMAELRRLKELGVGIVMDDFGTGYSSLSYLWKFPFDKIKIDRAFMLALDEENDEASTIVKTIIDLGRSLDVTVTVEGVETEDQLDFVSAAQCNQIQGFYFGKPLPTDAVASHILRDVEVALAAGYSKETGPLTAAA